MAETLLSIKQRLASIASISKITKAMKLVAAAKYTRARALYDVNINYAAAMRDCLMLCLQNVDFSKTKIPTCMIQKDGKRNLFVFITSSLGLCGSYNFALYREFQSQVKAEDDVAFIGEKGYRHLRETVHQAYDDFVELGSDLSFDGANHLRHWLDALYRGKDYRAVYIVYTKFVNSLSCIPVTERILPIAETDVPVQPKRDTAPIFEPDPYAVADLIVPHYCDALLYRRLLESKVSEEASRRNSMDTATDSADKLIAHLRLEYNKSRQQKITQEITEVVGGANAAASRGF